MLGMIGCAKISQPNTETLARSATVGGITHFAIPAMRCESSTVFNVDLVGVRLLVAVFFLIARLPQFFRFREQALQYCALVLVGLFRKQLVKVLHVALSSDFIDHGLPSVRRRLGCSREFSAQKAI